MEPTRVFWVGQPARATLAGLDDAGFTVICVPSLEGGGLAEPAVILLDGPSPEVVHALSLGLRESGVLIALAPSGDAVPLLRAGAHDVVPPSAGLEEVILRVRRWAELVRRRRRVRELSYRIRSLEAELADLRSTHDQLRALALTDELTGLGNLRSFRERLEQWLSFVERHGGSVSVIALDLDDFKEVNDTRGHAGGDGVLCDVAKTLQRSIRSVDHAARIGGDEFCLILPTTVLARATAVARRIQARLPVRASFGVASADAAEHSSLGHEDLTARADAALYRAKQLGKARVQTEEGVRPAARYRLP